MGVIAAVIVLATLVVLYRFRRTLWHAKGKVFLVLAMVAVAGAQLIRERGWTIFNPFLDTKPESTLRGDNFLSYAFDAATWTSTWKVDLYAPANSWYCSASQKGGADANTAWVWNKEQTECHRALMIGKLLYRAGETFGIEVPSKATPEQAVEWYGPCDEAGLCKSMIYPVIYNGKPVDAQLEFTWRADTNAGVGTIRYAVFVGDLRKTDTVRTVIDTVRIVIGPVARTPANK